MNQFELFDHDRIAPDLSLSEPLIWIERISIWEALGAEKPIREISFRKGLNIVATEIAGEGDTEPVGHDVGKTLLLRIIRYCLGEDRYASEETRLTIGSHLPNAYVLAHFHVDGSSWCVARPLGIGSGTRGDSWSFKTGDLQRVKCSEGTFPYVAFVDALKCVTRNCFADMGLPHADNRRANWLDLLGWLSRDQDCLNRHHADWRVAESQAGPRVLKRTDAYLVMRMALDLLGENEIDRVSNYDALKRTFDEREKAHDRLVSLLADTRKYIMAACNERRQPLSDPPEDALFGAAIVNHSQDKIKSLRALRDDDAEAQERIQKLSDNHDQAIAEKARLALQVEQLETHQEVLQKTIDELDQQENEDFLASLLKEKFECQFYPDNKELAAERGCPGLSSASQKEHPGDVGLQRQHQIEAHKKKIILIAEQVGVLRGDCREAERRLGTAKRTLNEAVSVLLSTKRDITKSIGHWEEIEQQGKEYRKNYAMLADLALSLEGRDKKLEDAKADVVAARSDIGEKGGMLSRCYQAVVKQILSEEATAMVQIDGHGVTPKVDKKSSGGTTLKTCSKVIGFDFGCLAASLCGLGNLPRFWMHDSPRSADTEDQLYHSVMMVSHWLESFYEEGSIPFQQIWTTTSAAPKQLDNETYIRERLSARTPEGRLLRIEL